MKYGCLFLILLGGLLGFSQSNISPDPAEKFASDQAIPIPGNLASTPFPKASAKKTVLNVKSLGDTLYNQSFTNGLPSNYTISNQNLNGMVWRWDTSYVPLRGQLTLTTPTINSTTANDGFMVLPSDFYNTPMQLPIIMNTWFTSPKITIPSTPGVFIKYEQYLSYCCNNTQLVLEISTDSINWDTYDAKRSLAINALNAPIISPVEEVVFDVSSSLANQTQFWYRFRSTGNSHYYWMIDDILFMEGPKQDLVLKHEALNFNIDNYTINPIYNQVPLDVFPRLPFSALIVQRGWTANTNVTLSADVTLNGSNTVYSSSFNAGTLIQGQDTLVYTGSPPFSPQNVGNFQVNLHAAGDSVDQIPGNESASFNFTVTDSVYARDDNNFDDGIGPANYSDQTLTSTGGTTVGDRFGSMYIIEPGFSKIIFPKSITYRVSENPRNIGVEIVPKIWLFDEDSTSLNASFVTEVASTYFPYTLTASDTSSFLTLPLSFGSAYTWGLDSGQYVVGWEVTTLPSGTTFEVLNDRSTALIQPDVSNFFWLGQEQIWRWSADNPGIRLNILKLPVALGVEEKGLAENKSELKIYPNPSNGQITVTLESTQEVEYTLSIRNVLGQIVYNEFISVKESLIKSIDLSQFDSGVYFLSLENKNERIIKKVIVR